MDEKRGMPGMGMLVVTSDGADLGRVKELSGDCFKVDAPMTTDYWLSDDTISNTDAGVVYLNFRREDLDDARLAADHTGLHRHA